MQIATTYYPDEIKISQKFVKPVNIDVHLKKAILCFPGDRTFYLPFYSEISSISIEELKEALKINEKEIIKELDELLQNYEIPQKYRNEIISKIKEQIRNEIDKQNLPHIEWLEEALFKLYIRLANRLLCI